MTSASDRLQAVPAAERISVDYKRYLRSLLQIRDPQIRQAIHSELESEHLIKGPYLEATPAYQRGASLRDLISDGTLPGSFAAFDGPALPLDRPLYLHQEQSLRKARAGRNLVVATGTGSGKTESFLLPILAHLADEHERGALGSGVRALLLYPMNALANDQVKRLREVLGNVPWVTFGRYTGQTKESAEDAAESFGAQFPGEVPIRNELLSREEMRESPPHLLLTNYAMLEYLLLRPEDLTLFDKHNDTWRFVVVDEAHVYDGARGTEVGMLLRRLQERVNAGALQGIATSATVGSDTKPEEVTQFASNLFGLPFAWNENDSTAQDVVRATRVPPPPADWAVGSEDSFAEWAAAPRRPADSSAPATGSPEHQQIQGEQQNWNAGDWGLDDPAETTQTTEELILSAAGDRAVGSVAQTLAREEHVRQLRDQLSNGPRSFRELARSLMADRSDPEAELAGLVDLAASLRDDEGNPVVSARYHLWVNAVDRAYVCLWPEHHHGYLHPRVKCDRCAAEGRVDVPAWLFATCQRCRTGYIFGAVADGRRGSRWLALSEHAAAVDEDEQNPDSAPEQAADSTAWLCPGCGTLEAQPGTCARCNVPRRAVVEVAPDDAHPREQESDTPYRCVGCGGAGNGLIRGMTVGSAGTTAVLTTSTYQELPGEDPGLPGDGRKLLTFSDSRQQAAYFAPYLESSYQRFLWRRLVLEAITSIVGQTGQPAGVDDVITRTERLAESHFLLRGMETALKRRGHVAGWVLAELAGTDERNSLEGTGLVRVTMDHSGIQLPAPLKSLGLSEAGAWALVDSMLASVRRAGAVQHPPGVDVPRDHPAFDYRYPDISFRGQGPDEKRHIKSWVPKRGENRRSNYLRRILEANGRPVGERNELLVGLWGWSTHQKLSGTLLVPTAGRGKDGITWRVALGSIRLEPAAEQYQCSRCGRWSPGSAAGVCPTMHCPGELVPTAMPDPESDENHYRHLYRELLPTALIAREHTAQWSTEKAAEVQDAFIKGEVNLLSCSTTFELGVDVGDLEATVLRNVPPTTSNYIQRAGRAGRRGRAAALVVTHARSRPHDAVMFQDPARMIAGTIRAPFVPVDNERIARRHVHSIAMSAFFRDMFRARTLRWHTMDEFFSTERSPNGPQLLAEYLDQVPRQIVEATLAAIPEVLHADLALRTAGWAPELVTRMNDLADQYQGEIDELQQLRKQAFDAGRKVDSYARLARTLQTRRLLDRLAVHNILPKYGFPVDVVELSTANIPSLGNDIQLDRDLAIALSEYAPGAQIVAGGRVIRSAGVRVRTGKELPQPWFGTCEGKDRHFVLSDHERLEECPHCGDSITMRQALYPEFGFVADPASDRIKAEPPRSMWTSEARTIRLAEKPQRRRIATAVGPVQLEWGKRAEFAIMAEGEHSQGWWICRFCGRGLPAWSNNELPESHKNPWSNRECRGTMRRRRLVHTFETDAVAITLPGTTVGDDQSVLAALLSGASDALEVPLDDLGGSVTNRRGLTRLVLFDTVPAGAGNAIRIGERFEEVLAAAIRRVADCSCGEDSSCYACLRHYRNQRYHEKLRRHDALARLRPLAETDPAGLLTTITDMGAATGTVTGQATPAATGPGGRPDDGPRSVPERWQQAVDLIDPSLVDIIKELAAADVFAPPVIGLEVNDGSDMIEAAWQDQRLALLPEDESELAARLKPDGWRVVLGSEPDAAKAVTEIVGGPTSG